MRIGVKLVCAALLTASPFMALAIAPAAESGGMQCNDGAIKKTIEGAKWKMRGCSDGYSLLFLFKEGSPDKLAYIAINRKGLAYEMAGGGNTRQPEVIAAARWAKRLTEPEIAALYAETQARK